MLILLIVTLVLIKGIQESSTLNSFIVLVKLTIVVAIIAIGWHFINPANHAPFLIPAETPGHEGTFTHGWGGVLGGASIVFFAFIGFDAVSTAAQETKDPARDMPRGILGSLALCTVLYILFGWVITGVGNWREFLTVGKEASVAYVIQHHMPGYEWLGTFVTVAILFGFSSVILVMLLGQSRVFYSMSLDGLLPKILSDLHPTFRTPYKSNMLLFLFVGALAGLLPGDITGDLTSIGTLFAFVLVSLGVWILRVKQPQLNRPFRTPLVPFVPLMGMLICSAMIISLKHQSQTVAFLWMLIGLAIYFAYSRTHSKLNDPEITADVTQTALR
jgi:basic amino acid/polyamine antiporter, APA family